jgi:serine/threonine protein kinase
MFRKKIGEGSYGCVYSAVDMMNSVTVAVKVILNIQT